MAAAITTLGRLGIDSSNPVTQRFDFNYFDLGVQVDLKDMNGTRGKYSKDSNRVRTNLTHVAPRVRCQPTSLELSRLLQWILGGTPSGTPTVTYPLGNTTVQRYVAFDPNGGNLWTLTGVAVDEARFKAAQGEPLDLDLSLVGQTYAVSGSFPAIALDVSTQPFLFVDAVLVVGGTTVQSKDFELAVANGIDRNRFFNSGTLTATNKLTRKITCHVTIPYGDYSTLFNTGSGSSVSVTATFTNGGAVLTFNLGGVRFKPKNPQSEFNQEVMLPLEGEAFSADGTTEVLITTLNPGP
ncbi:MAG: hypothetical protein JWO38_6859 [Gemmataceae bacterium]|nr:hypothetical protein [Gemmataceae bacterium]